MSGTTPATTNTAQKPGVRHILENLKYPDYIRNHQVFQKLNKITKVFPGIGLPNTVEDCAYSNLTEARNAATQLLYYEVRDHLYTGYTSVRASTHMELRTLLNEVRNYVESSYVQMMHEDEGRLAIKFHRDVGTIDGKPFARNGESFFKAYNKLVEKCKDAGVTLRAMDAMPGFKTFSSINIPADKRFKIVFSSDGEQGAWDISTISMRGISSCQTWGSTQSRGLIGSISSRYVGVIYITNGENFNEYGSKMLRRAMVRFCINKTTKKPALLMDRIYPSDDAVARKTMRDFLHNKTKLPVLFAGETGWTDYVLPNDVYWKLAPFQTNEYTYMDTKIPWKGTITKDYSAYAARIGQLDNELVSRVHNNIVKKLDEYCVDKKTHRAVFKGGVANLLVSMRKHLGRDYFSSNFLPRLANITAAYPAQYPPVQQFETAKQYERAVIKAAFANMKHLTSLANSACKQQGKYMKFYPTSADKLVNLVLSEYRKELLQSYKKVMDA